jgi:hypothetical protein
MSYSNILSGSKINPQYLPTGPAPAHPYIENPFQDPVDGGNQPLSNLASVVVGSAAPPRGQNIVDVEGSVLLTGILTLDAEGERYVRAINDDLELTNDVSGGKLLFAGPLGIGEVFDTLNNPPPVQDTTVVQQLTGTAGGNNESINVPAGPSNDGVTVATLNLNQIGTDKNSFVVYLYNIIGDVATPDASAKFKFYLSAEEDEPWDSTKGVLQYVTGDIANGTGIEQNGITLNYRQSTPLTTLYLNVSPGDTQSGAQISDYEYFMDVYASKI